MRRFGHRYGAPLVANRDADTCREAAPVHIVAPGHGGRQDTPSRFADSNRYAGRRLMRAAPAYGTARAGLLNPRLLPVRRLRAEHILDVVSDFRPVLDPVEHHRFQHINDVRGRIL